MNPPYDIVIYYDIANKINTYNYKDSELYSKYFIREKVPLMLLHRVYNINNKKLINSTYEDIMIGSYYTQLDKDNTALQKLIKDRIRTTVSYNETIKDKEVYFLRTKLYYKDIQIPYDRICQELIGNYKFIDVKLTVFKAPIFYNSTRLPNEIYLYNDLNQLIFIISTLQLDNYSFYDITNNTIVAKQSYLIKVITEESRNYIQLSNFISLLLNEDLLIVYKYNIKDLYNYFKNYVYNNVLIRTRVYMKDKVEDNISLVRMNTNILKLILKLLQGKSMSYRDQVTIEFLNKIDDKIPFKYDNITTVIKEKSFDLINNKMFQNNYKIVIKTLSVDEYIDYIMLKLKRSFNDNEDFTIIELIMKLTKITIQQDILQKHIKDFKGATDKEITYIKKLLKDELKRRYNKSYDKKIKKRD